MADTTSTREAPSGASSNSSATAGPTGQDLPYQEESDLARPQTPKIEDCDIYYISGDGRISWNTTSDADGESVLGNRRRDERSGSQLTLMLVDSVFTPYGQI